MYTSKKTFRKWQSEFNEAVRKQDVQGFRKFYEKWRYLGIYASPLPDDDKMLEISLRKMLFNMASATDQEKRQAEQWLMSRGYSTSLR